MVIRRPFIPFIATFVIAAAAFAQNAPPMTMTVSGFPDGGDIPVKFTQAVPGVPTGEGTSPEIKWANVPQGTQTFVLNKKQNTPSVKFSSTSENGERCAN